MRTGFLNINKPPGMSSHDVVGFVRYLLPRGTKVGHLGTLDPGACGVLPLAVGWATRTITFLPPHDKFYRAEISLGAETSTDDANGEVLTRGIIPKLDRNILQEKLQTFLGKSQQVPPKVCAVHVEGARAYELWRSGQVFELEPREVEIFSLNLVDFNGKDRLIVDVHCGAGTYIRSLARDLGRLLGCGGYLSFLLRLKSGIFRLEDTLCIEDLRHRNMEEILWPIEAVLSDSIGRVCWVENSLWQGGQEFSRVYDREGGEIDLHLAKEGESWIFFSRSTGKFKGLGRVVDSASFRFLRVERLYTD